LEILRQVRKADYSGGKTALYAVVASLRPIELDIKQNEAFAWMRAVQQGAIPRPTLEKELGHVIELDKLLKGACVAGRRRSAKRRRQYYRTVWTTDAELLAMFESP
jgi:hypothetical protein